MNSIKDQENLSQKKILLRKLQKLTIVKPELEEQYHLVFMHFFKEFKY